MARIIVIEDDPFLTDLVEQLLRIAEHDVASMSNPDLLESDQDVDLVVTDLFGEMATRQSAVDQITRIRGSVGSVPIVICSGRTPLPPGAARELGVVDIITKPFDIDDFINRVENALQDSSRDTNGE